MATTFKQITGKQTIIDPVQNNTLQIKDTALFLTRFAGPTEQELQITIGDTYIQIKKDQVKDLLNGCIDFLSEEHLDEI